MLLGKKRMLVLSCLTVTDHDVTLQIPFFFLVERYCATIMVPSSEPLPFAIPTVYP